MFPFYAVEIRQKIPKPSRGKNIQRKKEWVRIRIYCVYTIHVPPCRKKNKQQNLGKMVKSKVVRPVNRIDADSLFLFFTLPYTQIRAAWWCLVYCQLAQNGNAKRNCSNWMYWSIFILFDYLNCSQMACMWNHPRESIYIAFVVR